MSPRFGAGLPTPPDLGPEVSPGGATGRASPARPGRPRPGRLRRPSGRNGIPIFAVRASRLREPPNSGPGGGSARIASPRRPSVPILGLGSGESAPSARVIRTGPAGSARTGQTRTQDGARHRSRDVPRRLLRSATAPACRPSAWVPRRLPGRGLTQGEGPSADASRERAGAACALVAVFLTAPLRMLFGGGPTKPTKPPKPGFVGFVGSWSQVWMNFLRPGAAGDDGTSGPSRWGTGSGRAEPRESRRRGKLSPGCG
jgi:hypothetical protein